jgi:hypothetical protein
LALKNLELNQAAAHDEMMSHAALHDVVWRHVM